MSTAELSGTEARPGPPQSAPPRLERGDLVNGGATAALLLIALLVLPSILSLY